MQIDCVYFGGVHLTLILISDNLWEKMPAVEKGFFGAKYC